MHHAPEDDEQDRRSDPFEEAGNGGDQAAALATVERDDGGDQADELYAIGHATE